MFVWTDGPHIQMYNRRVIKMSFDWLLNTPARTFSLSWRLDCESFMSLPPDWARAPCPLWRFHQPLMSKSLGVVFFPAWLNDMSQHTVSVCACSDGFLCHLVMQPHLFVYLRYLLINWKRGAGIFSCKLISKSCLKFTQNFMQKALIVLRVLSTECSSLITEPDGA